jgi:hypothetical protein
MCRWRYLVNMGTSWVSLIVKARQIKWRSDSSFFFYCEWSKTSTTIRTLLLLVMIPAANNLKIQLNILLPYCSSPILECH